MRVALDELPAVKVWGLRTVGLIWAGVDSHLAVRIRDERFQCFSGEQVI